jgi:hypothetical protein
MGCERLRAEEAHQQTCRREEAALHQEGNADRQA